MAKENKENKISLKRKQILELFKSLAQSQGFYGRLLRSISELSEEDREQFWQNMEAKNFKSDLDVILYVEC